jgi:hypothetical protein
MLMKYFGILFFLVICNAVSATTAKLPVLTGGLRHIIADSDTVFKKKLISVGVKYGSDIQFFGRTGPIKYPYMSTDVIYNAKSGLFVYGSAFKVLGYNPLIDEIDLGAGYLYKYTKNFSGTISYTRFIFNKDAAEVIKSASSNDIDFKNAYDWKFAKSSVTFDYLFGKENDYFITFNTSKHFESNFGIFDDKDYLSFNPTISAILGTQNFVGRFYTDHPNRFLIDNIYVPGVGVKPQDYDNGRFNALNYSIAIPIAYNRPHYTLEASWRYSIPVNVEGVLENRHEVFFSLTFYYLFY